MTTEHSAYDLSFYRDVNDALALAALVAFVCVLLLVVRSKRNLLPESANHLRGRMPVAFVTAANCARRPKRQKPRRVQRRGLKTVQAEKARPVPRAESRSASTFSVDAATGEPCPHGRPQRKGRKCHSQNLRDRSRMPPRAAKRCSAI